MVLIWTLRISNVREVKKQIVYNYCDLKSEQAVEVQKKKKGSPSSKKHFVCEQLWVIPFPSIES